MTHELVLTWYVTSRRRPGSPTVRHCRCSVTATSRKWPSTTSFFYTSIMFKSLRPVAAALHMRRVSVATHMRGRTARRAPPNAREGTRGGIKRDFWLSARTLSYAHDPQLSNALRGGRLRRRDVFPRVVDPRPLRVKSAPFERKKCGRVKIREPIVRGRGEVRWIQRFKLRADPSRVGGAAFGEGVSEGGLWEERN